MKFAHAFFQSFKNIALVSWFLTNMHEHNNTIGNTAIDGHFANHCKKCDAKPKCVLLFSQTVVLYQHREKATPEIVEAAEIASATNRCVSIPSILLSVKEHELLAWTHVLF